MSIDKRSNPILPNNLRSPSDYVEWLETKNRELRSENAELREALTDIRKVKSSHKANGHQDWKRTCNFMRGRATAALATHKPASDEIGE